MSNLSLQLPDLLDPTSSFPFQINKNCKLATDGSETWLLEGGGPVLFERERETLRGVKYGLLASLCSPTADAPQLRILTDFFSLVVLSHLRVLECCEAGSPGHGWSSSTHVESAEDGFELMSANTLLKSIVPVLRRISDRLPKAHQAEWNKRFTMTVKAFAKAQLKLYENLKSAVVPTLSEYVRLRRETYGTSIFIDLLDLLEISPRPWDLSPKETNIVNGLTTWAIDVVAWILDIFSYASGATGVTRCNSHNVVALLTTHKNLSVQGAMSYAGNMVKEALEEFRRLELELITTSSPTVGSWGWLSLVKSAVGLSKTNSPRPDWKFLADIVALQYPNEGDTGTHTQPNPEALDQQRMKIERYVQALKDYIIGSIHWGYETEIYFGQKGDEVRSFGWVFLSQSDNSTTD